MSTELVRPPKAVVRGVVAEATVAVVVVAVDRVLEQAKRDPVVRIIFVVCVSVSVRRGCRVCVYIDRKSVV